MPLAVVSLGDSRHSRVRQRAKPVLVFVLTNLALKLQPEFTPQPFRSAYQRPTLRLAYRAAAQ